MDKLPPTASIRSVSPVSPEAGRVGRVEARPVVDDLHAQRGPVIRQHHLGLGGVCVLEHVHQGFAVQEVGGTLDVVGVAGAGQFRPCGQPDADWEPGDPGLHSSKDALIR